MFIIVSIDYIFQLENYNLSVSLFRFNLILDSGISEIFVFIQLEPNTTKIAWVMRAWGSNKFEQWSMTRSIVHTTFWHHVRTRGLHGADGCQTSRERSSNNRVFSITDLFTDQYQYL